jgi:hypothetical protein
LRILIDECLPTELADELIDHEVETVQQVGWSGLKNGALMQNIAGRFEVFLTIDKRIQSEQKIPKNVRLITVRGSVKSDTRSASACASNTGGFDGNSTWKIGANNRSVAPTPVRVFCLIVPMLR